MTVATRHRGFMVKVVTSIKDVRVHFDRVFLCLLLVTAKKIKNDVSSVLCSFI